MAMPGVYQINIFLRLVLSTDLRDSVWQCTLNSSVKGFVAFVLIDFLFLLLLKNAMRTYVSYFNSQFFIDKGVLSSDAIDCFKCSSVNGSNPDCEDVFHNDRNQTFLHSPCLAGWKDRRGLFPATVCLKLSGYFCNFYEYSFIMWDHINKIMFLDYIYSSVK